MSSPSETSSDNATPKPIQPETPIEPAEATVTAEVLPSDFKLFRPPNASTTLPCKIKSLGQLAIQVQWMHFSWFRCSSWFGTDSCGSDALTGRSDSCYTHTGSGKQAPAITEPPSGGTSPGKARSLARGELPDLLNQSFCSSYWKRQASASSSQIALSWRRSSHRQTRSKQCTHLFRAVCAMMQNISNSFFVRMDSVQLNE